MEKAGAMSQEQAGAKRTIVLWLVPGLILVAYVLTYLILSLRGAFEPVEIGLNGVKEYEWAPAGFMDRALARWPQGRPSLYLTFLPLHRLDCRYWHTERKRLLGLYPVHDLSYVQL